MRTFLSGPAHTHSLTADVYNVPACFPARAQVTGWIKATYLVPKSDMRRGMDAVLQAARATSAHGALAVTVADQGHHSCAAGSSARGVVVRQNTGIQRTRGASVPALRTVQGEDDEFRLDSAADAGSGDGLIVGMPAAPGQADIGIASEEPTACEHEGSHDDTHFAAVMYAPRVGAAGAVDGAPLGGATTEGAATTARVTAAAGPATAGALEGSAVDGAAVLAALSSAAAERADAGSAAEGAAPAAAAGLATHARAARSNAARPPRAQRHSTSGGGPEEAERSGAGSRPPAGARRRDRSHGRSSDSPKPKRRSGHPRGPVPTAEPTQPSRRHQEKVRPSSPFDFALGMENLRLAQLSMNSHRHRAFMA